MALPPVPVRMGSSGSCQDRDRAIDSTRPSPIFATERDYYLDDTAVEAAREKLDWVSRFAPPGGTLLDVGANYGHFLAQATD